MEGAYGKGHRVYFCNSFDGRSLSPPKGCFRVFFSSDCCNNVWRLVAAGLAQNFLSAKKRLMLGSDSF